MAVIRNMKKLPFVIMIIFLLGFIVLNGGNVAHAEEAPYQSYSYNGFGEAVPCPHGYLPLLNQRYFIGDSGTLKNPTDLFVEKTNNLLYIVDSGNNRILEVDEDYQVMRIISKFDLNGEESSFNNPGGVFVDKNKKMYICDTDNSRIVILDGEGKLIDVFGKPESELIVEDSVYKPSKVLVDEYGRIYVLAKGVYQGLFQLETDGSFINYYGANQVEMTAQRIIQNIWKKFISREAASKLESVLPIEYSNIFVDQNNFIFATASASQTNINQIVKMNLKGDNILPFKSPSWYKNSMFTDVHVNEDGIFTVIDSNNGRIIQASDNGVAMFFFGARGNMTGAFQNPVSVEEFGGNLIVLDSVKGSLTELQPTSFGKSVRTAVGLYNKGLYVENIEYWEEVIKRDSNYLIAYTGLGSAYYQLEEYKTSMKYYKLSQNQEGFSTAYKDYSLSAMRENFVWIVVIVFAIILASSVFKLVKKKRKVLSTVAEFSTESAKAKNMIDEIKFLFYTIRHPSHGFDRIKWNGKGSVAISLVIVFFFAFSEILRQQSTGFAFNNFNPSKINVLTTFAVFIGIIILWVFGNWSTALLIDGEGKLKQIIIGSTYALVPYILIRIFVTIITNFISLEFLPFINMIIFIATLWSVVLMFLAMYNIHQLTFGKAILIIFFTLIVMVIATLLLLLLYSLFQQIFVFFYTIFSEMMYRSK